MEKGSDLSCKKEGPQGNPSRGELPFPLCLKGSPGWVRHECRNSGTRHLSPRPRWLTSNQGMLSTPLRSSSVAILLYLSRKYKAPDHWYPQDLQTRARVDEYLAWQHTALRSCCTRAMWQKVSRGDGGQG